MRAAQVLFVSNIQPQFSELFPGLDGSSTELRLRFLGIHWKIGRGTLHYSAVYIID